MTIADSVLLGSIQGLTEFLPISSSGHLILARELLGANTSAGLTYDAVLQLGTTLAAVLYFRSDLWRLFRSLLPKRRQDKGQDAKADRNLVLILVLASVPAAVAGKLLEETMETAFRSAFLVGVTLLVGSLLFVYAEKAAKRNLQTVSLKNGLLIGLFQCLALVPGMSRSGMTISGGLLTGLTVEAATRFSFLLSIPIIAGSGLLKLAKVASGSAGPVDFGASHLLIGFLLSFALGYACIAWLLRIIRAQGLKPFVIYRLLLANAVFLLALYRGGA